VNNLQLTEICNIYASLGSRMVSPFNWIDAGSAGSTDLYLLPFFCLPGVTILVDGREESSSRITRLFEEYGLPLKSDLQSYEGYIDSESRVRQFFVNAGGSTFYPSKDESLRFISDFRDEFQTKLVQTTRLEDVVSSILDSGISFCKVDIEGSEHDFVDALSKFAQEKLPFAIEIEVNVGRTDCQESFGDFISKLDRLGFRLCDLRRSHLTVTSEFWTKLPSNEASTIISPVYQGVLCQFDGFFINQKLLTEQNLSFDALMHIFCILSAYRQFPLIAKLVEHNKLINGEQKRLMEDAIESLTRVLTEVWQNNPYSIAGLHPYFNWLKQR